MSEDEEPEDEEPDYSGQRDPGMWADDAIDQYRDRQNELPARYVLQAHGTGLGWVDCVLFGDLHEAEREAVELLNRDAAWLEGKRQVRVVARPGWAHFQCKDFDEVLRTWERIK